jgi:hypothetical protein
MQNSIPAPGNQLIDWGSVEVEYLLLVGLALFEFPFRLKGFKRENNEEVLYFFLTVVYKRGLFIADYITSLEHSLYLTILLTTSLEHPTVTILLTILLTVLFL